MSTQPFLYKIPQLFRPIVSQQNAIVKHFIALREKRQYRHEQQAVIVQGAKTIQELRNQGHTITSLAITTGTKPIVSEEDIQYPASAILKNPSLFPAKHYYVTNINIARRILGTSSRPGIHDLFAEIPIPAPKQFDLKDVERLLVFDKINDPGNLGTLVRTAQALGWHQGFITGGTCDLYNDKTIRASRALSLSWQYQQMDTMHKTLKTLKENGFTPIVADMLSPEATVMWSPEHGTTTTSMTPGTGTGVWFWNFNQNEPLPLPKELKKMALILSSEHHGTSDVLMNEIRVSVPMATNVESINVANAGAIIMDNLNRIHSLLHQNNTF